VSGSHKICRACGRAFRGVEIFCPEDGSRLHVAKRSSSRAADPLVGMVLDSRYRVSRILGEGGMGIVYEAFHQRIDRKVAIKVLREDFSSRPDVVERFRREAKSASRIGHPNIVDVMDFGDTPLGSSYFVMEMLEGEDLADLLSREVRLSPSRAVAIAYQCCRALAAAHEKGIVHRDLKPENIFLLERGGFPDFVKLVDFGVAKMTELDHAEGSGGRKLTRTGMIFGTPEYMSPEQANGQPLDHRVDIYALGIILYETLTGSVPFEGESFMAVLSKHAVQTVPPLREMWPGLSVSPELEAVVMCALTKSRDQRYPHMRAFAEALEAVPELPDTIPRDSHVPVRTSTPGSLVAPVRALTPEPRASDAVATASVPEPSLTPLSTETSLSPQEVPVGLAASEQRSPKLFLPRAYVPMAAAVVIVGAFISALVLARPDRNERAAPAAAAAAPEPMAAATPEPAAAPMGVAAPEPAALKVPTTFEPAPVPVPAAPEPVPELITLHVSTRPSGAKLSLVGGAQVCDATPCEVEVVRGAPVSFLARRGKQRAMTTLEPRDGAQILLVLDNTKSAAPAEEREALEADVAAAQDDLKVPAAFK
jgi:serine/threonine-protein kinase